MTEKREREKQLSEDFRQFLEEVTEVAGVKVVSRGEPLIADGKQLRALAKQILAAMDEAPAAVILGSIAGPDARDKVGMIALLSRAAVEKGLSAEEIIRASAPLIGGGGGGDAELAQAGGRDPDRLGDAVEAAHRMIEQKVG